MVYLYNLFDSAIKLKLILTNYAMLLLNTPIEIDPDIFLPMWTEAPYRACVDEGSFNLLNYIEMHSLHKSNLYPHLLTGDFRSLKPELLEDFKNHKVIVVPTVNDDLTDFTKSLYEVADRNKEIDSVIAIVEPTSRLDHTFANLNTLYLANTIFGRHVDIYLLGKYSISWLIHPGKSVIHVPEWMKKNPCGILAFAPRKSNVTTTGLRWNLNGQAIEFGGLLSTSNKFSQEPTVTIETDTPLIWTMMVDKEDIYAHPCKQKRKEPLHHHPQNNK